MASSSTPVLAQPSEISLSRSPTLRGLKKVLSKDRRRSTDISSEQDRRSVDSLSLDIPETPQSARSNPNREDTTKSSHDGVRKLVPGHSKRQRQRMREVEIKAAQEGTMRGRQGESLQTRQAESPNRSTSSLLTDGSEMDTPPPLVSRNSHTGYFTTSSPLITTTQANDGSVRILHDGSSDPTESAEVFPQMIESDSISREPSPKGTPQLGSTPVLPAPGLIDRADSLKVEDEPRRRNSISRLRAISPARKLKNVFKSSKSPRGSPERSPFAPYQSGPEATGRPASLSDSLSTEKHPTAPSGAVEATIDTTRKARPFIDTRIAAPRTPPNGSVATPLTTVTPPTPVAPQRPPSPLKSVLAAGEAAPEIVVSPSGNMISHRRIHSASSAAHTKSKLSTSAIPPLTPTPEDAQTSTSGKPSSRQASNGFFSSWMSAAQNAASTLTNSFAAQNRSRSGTSASDSVATMTTTNRVETDEKAGENDVAQRQLAVETMGTGDLDFSHLGIDDTTNDRSSLNARSDTSHKRQISDLRRDEVQAKVEDMWAKRAVSAAYEKTGETTPVAEITDPIASVKSFPNLETGGPTGTLTPPPGSVFDGEPGPIKRSSSVRSKLASRRSRGSSVNTGAPSTIGQMIAGSTSTLVNPAAPPKVSGFTPAAKSRNRGFHQQFRSVPEDDNLIEDWSCALQKEILLAGRIYISEGHICFSSNILGWVTTLIISFEEIVSVERENTAMIIPNAIAIQTLHARHTFRSLLSREATFDLMIGIWKVNHPTSFQKSVNGKQMIAEQAKSEVATALGTEAATHADSEDEDSDEEPDDDADDDDDEGNDDTASAIGSAPSLAGSEFIDARSINGRANGTNNTASALPNGASGVTSGDATSGPASVTAATGPGVDFPGPATHAPTDCTDATTHYEVVLKDETIPAPLGKVYSLLYGPQSGVFVRKYLVDECKCMDLVMEDDKKGLNNEIKSREYSYIKPLGGSIGPKQTKCITVETVDFFDLEKSVSVTCSTQTPDVPSGSAFSTKTRYCLSWAAGNFTRLQMNCTIEWTAKSWLKGPIEKGAKDGQQQYGDGLVAALKAAVGRSRATTSGSRRVKSKRKKKGDKKAKDDRLDPLSAGPRGWGWLEPARPVLEPATDILKPVIRLETAIGILGILVIVMWLRSSGDRSHLGYPQSPLNRIERLAAYEELWQKQESELWHWLEDRAGVDRVMLGDKSSAASDGASTQKKRQAERKKQLKSKDMAAKARAESWSQKEMREAVRLTRERLDAMEQALGTSKT